MKRTIYAVALVASALCTSQSARAQFGELLIPGASPQTHPEGRPDFDARRIDDHRPTAEVRADREAGRGGEMRTRREATRERLAQRVPGLVVHEHPFLGTPRWVGSPHSLLTERQTFGRVEPKAVVERFVAENQPLFEIDPSELGRARMSREYMTRHNGVSHMTFQQRHEGVDVFQAELRANVTRDGALINVSSTMLPRPERGFDIPARTVTPLAAIHAAAADVGIAITVEPQALGEPQGADERIEWSQTPDFRTDRAVTTQLVYFPRSRREIVPAWFVIVPEIGIGNTYEIVVDATDGSILWRYNELQHLVGGTQDVTMRVFTSDSPAPGSPGNATPNGFQFPFVARDLVTVTAASVTPYSPNGWIADGDNETNGNNVDAHLDLNADNSPDLPRPQGSPFRVFDFPFDPAQAPSTYRDAAVTQLFYLCNNYHDRLYALGFDEASGNFQVDNFGNGGAGGDPVQADAQDGVSVNNANFGTPPDGQDPRMQMFVFNGPNPDRDGDFDAEIVYHEYTHGLSNRLVGVGQVSGEQSGGMGEGWGDFFGVCLNAEPGDDVDGVFPMGGHTTYQLSGLTDNYYFGIRRFPHCTDLMVNPQTYADIDPAQQAYDPSIPRSPIIGNTADQVHNVGEVWCGTLLQCRANLVNAHGFVGNEEIMQLVVDGMKLSPGNPSFLEARDAILQADVVNNGGANLGLLWQGFAKKGMGANASHGGGGNSTTGVVEDFTIPSLILFDYVSAIPTQLDPNQPSTFDVNVSGIGADQPISGSGQLHYSVNGGAFVAIPMTENGPNQYTATLPGLACFDEVDFYVSSNSTAGTVTDPAGAPAEVREATVYTDTLVMFDDDFEANLGWTVTNSVGLGDGAWTRGVPVDGDRGDPPADSDGSGQCYVTDNVSGNSDVDDGTTTLTSPVIDGTGGGILHYDFWLNDISTGPLGAEDSLQVQVATNAAGTNWQTVRTYVTAEPEWRSDEILIGTEVAATSTIRIRFSVSDLSPGDVVEGGIDAVVFERLQCTGIESFCFGSSATCPCANGGAADSGCDNAQGTGGVKLEVTAFTPNGVGGGTATLTASSYPAASTPTAVVVRSTATNGGTVFGDGVLCLNTPVVRLAATLAGGGTSSHNISHGAGAGTFYYQVWYRNQPASFCNPDSFNTSNGVMIPWP